MSGPTRHRYRWIRRADNTDDEQGSAAILAAVTSSSTSEDFQVFYLSRLRQIIYGTGNPGKHWYSDFPGEGILSLSELTAASVGAVKDRVGVGFVGAQDSSNRVFRTTPDFFAHDLAGSGQTIEVFHNGRRLMQVATADPSIGDYTVAESGGVGTGYDTITLLTLAPTANSLLVGNYQV